jgi:hypothetical protein
MSGVFSLTVYYTSIRTGRLKKNLVKLSQGSWFPKPRENAGKTEGCTFIAGFLARFHS